MPTSMKSSPTLPEGSPHVRPSGNPYSSFRITARDQASRPHRCIARRASEVSQDVKPQSFPEASVADRLKQGAVAVALGLCATFATLPAVANNVRVEDVDNPSMQAGLMAANDGRFDDAERFFKIVLNDNQESASAWSNLGNVHLSLGRPREASKEFSKAIALAPQAPVPYMNRALAKEALGVEAARSGDTAAATDLYRDALQDCDVATSHDPKEFAAWFNKGNIKLRLGDFHAALECYTKAADLAPGISGYRLREAELMFQDGQADKSDRVMRSVVRRNPNYAEAQAALAAVEWASGKGESAEEHFEVATRIEPRWSRMEYIQRSTRWPPALYDAMQKFLSITPSAS